MTTAHPVGDGPTLNARTLIRHTGLNYASFVYLSLCGFILTPQIIHNVGSAAFGVFALTGMLIGFASLFDFGIGISAHQEIAARADDKDPDALSSLVSSVFFLYTLTGAGALVVGLALYPLASHSFNLSGDLLAQFQACYLLAIAAAALSFPQSIFTATLAGLSDYGAWNLIVVVHATASLVGSLVILHLGGNVAALQALNLFLMLVHFAAKAALVRFRHGVRVSYRLAHRDQLSGVRRSAGWVFGINVGSKVIFDIDRIVVGVLLGPVSVAAYSVALSVSTLFREVAGRLNVITLTSASTLFARNESVKLRDLYLEATRVSAIVMLPGLGLTYAIGPTFLQLWVSQDIADLATTVLFTLVTAMAVFALQSTASHVLMAVGERRKVGLITLAEAALNLSLSIFLGRHIGLVGVALGTLIPASLGAVVLIRAASGTLGLSTRTLTRAIGPSLVQCAVITWGGRALLSHDTLVTRSLIALIAVAGSFYVLVLAANIFGPEKSRRTYLAALGRQAS